MCPKSEALRASCLEGVPTVSQPARYSRDIQKSPFGVRVSPCGPLAQRESLVEDVPPSNEGKMNSIPALSTRSALPMSTFEEPCPRQADFGH